MSNVINQRNLGTPPKVSIGMPVFNGEPFIREALDSLLAQTFSDFELIISDNGSTDGTEAICREYAATDPRIRYVRQPKNRGALFNFQFVLDEARGEYFMWAAHDDRRLPEFLRLALEVFAEDNSCGLVFCDYRVLNLKTEEVTNAYVGMFNSAKPQINYLIRLLSPCPSLIYGLHRLSVLKQFPLQSYDFLDVHLTHWYAIHSVVKIIPIPLYITVTNGVRVPYSSTGVKIDPNTFFKKESTLLFSSFNIMFALPLYCLLRYFYFKNCRSLNNQIEQAQREDQQRE
jgi:glycosyltransferase involved in cell wall biosynthesis